MPLLVGRNAAGSSTYSRRSVQPSRRQSSGRLSPSHLVRNGTGGRQRRLWSRFCFLVHLSCPRRSWRSLARCPQVGDSWVRRMGWGSPLSPHEQPSEIRSAWPGGLPPFAACSFWRPRSPSGCLCTMLQTGRSRRRCGSPRTRESCSPSPRTRPMFLRNGDHQRPGLPQILRSLLSSASSISAA